MCRRQGRRSGDLLLAQEIALVCEQQNLNILTQLSQTAGSKQAIIIGGVRCSQNGYAHQPNPSGWRRNQHISARVGVVMVLGLFTQFVAIARQRLNQWHSRNGFLYAASRSARTTRGGGVKCVGIIFAIETRGRTWRARLEWRVLEWSAVRFGRASKQHVTAITANRQLIDVPRT